MFKRLFGGQDATGAGNTPDATTVDVARARALQEGGAQLIDVREPGEFAAGHACGARNIPLDQLANRIGEVDRAGTVLVICQSGNRSKVGRDLLARQRVADARNVAGGTKAWRAAGLPLA